MGGRPIRGQLLKGTTPLLVLTVLRDGELYGYEIAQRIRERSGGAFAPSEGSLYPALHSLEAAGALAATWREGDKGPRRRYYRITPKGGALLAEHEAEWASFSAGVARAVAGPSRG
jgi:PadR family transcriptional regulator, regulatory protein PadR